MQHHRLYISADIEGVACVATTEHTGPQGFQAREWMTNEVIAARDAAFHYAQKYWAYLLKASTLMCITYQ